MAGATMALAGLGTTALIAQVLFDQAVSAIALWSVSSWRPRLTFSWRHLRDLFRVGFNQMATDLVWAASEQTDRALLGSLGAAAVGYYSVAQRLRTLMGDLLGSSTQTAILPLFARIADDKKRVVRDLQTAQATLSMIIIPVGVGLAVIAPGLIPFAIGPRWAPSILPSQIMICGAMTYWLGYFFQPVMTALGRPEVRLRLAILRGLTLIVLLVLGLRYGIAGVASAFVISHAIFYGIELAVLRELVASPVPAYVAALLKPCLAGRGHGRAAGRSASNPDALSGAGTAGADCSGRRHLCRSHVDLARERVSELVTLVGQLRRQS
jgi:PST family polysaccharide transporter